MQSKFKNYPILVIANKISWGKTGSKQSIRRVEKINDNIYKVFTDVENIEIDENEYDILEKRIDKELSKAHDEALQRAYFEDQNSGFHQYEM